MKAGSYKSLNAKAMLRHEWKIIKIIKSECYLSTTRHIIIDVWMIPEHYQAIETACSTNPQF